MLEGESQAYKTLESKKGSLENDGHGLLIVDFLSLHKKFNYKKYRLDLLGFGLAVLFVLGILAFGFYFSFDRLIKIYDHDK